MLLNKLLHSFPFLSTNNSFELIVLFYIFFFSIFSLTFFSKTLIHFFASFSNHTSSSSSFQIFYSSTTLLFSLYFLSSAFSLSSASFLLFSSLVLPLLLYSFTFATLVFPALASIFFYIHLDIWSFSLLQSSNLFQDYDRQAIIFPRLCSTFVHQSHLSPSFPHVLDNRY